MIAASTTLTEFLLARIAEDAAAADLVLRPYGDATSSNDAAWWGDEREWFKMGLSSDETPLVMRHSPQRVLAECEAKRRIVELHRQWDDASGLEHGPEFWSAPVEAILSALALPYADHPDYRDEWRP